MLARTRAVYVPCAPAQYAAHWPSCPRVSAAYLTLHALLGSAHLCGVPVLICPQPSPHRPSPPRMRYHRTCSTPPCPLVSYPCAMMAWPRPTRSAILNLRPHPTEPDPICVPSPSGHARLAIHLWHRCTYLVRPLALLAVCPVQPHCFLFIDVRVPHVRPPHAKRTRAPRPRRSTARPPVRASPCSCAAGLPCATPHAPHGCSTMSRASNRTGSSTPMPACSYASRSHRSTTLVCILATVLLAPTRCPTLSMSPPVPAPHPRHVHVQRAARPNLVPARPGRVAAMLALRHAYVLL
jgi:hypothetical protein